jgi:hypothetical protein
MTNDLMEWNWDNPTAKVEAESVRANHALRDYAGMGVGRSLLALYTRYITMTIAYKHADRAPTRVKSVLAGWSAKYHWRDRVARYDELEMIREETIRHSVWDERRKETAERDWEQGEKLRKLGDDILAEAPAFVKTSRKFIKGKDGQPDREIITVGLDAKAMAMIIEIGSHLQQQASGLEIERRSNELAKLSDEEIRAKYSSIIEGFSVTANGDGEAGNSDTRQLPEPQDSGQ